MQAIKPLIDAAWQAIAVRDKATAMDYAKQAHQQAPKSPDVLHILGLLASRDNQHAIALQLLQQSIDSGGKTPRKLRDMAEALFAAGYAEQALIPLEESINLAGKDSHSMGLKSAILLDLEQWGSAKNAAIEAIDLDKTSLAWYLNAAFATLMQQDFKLGFSYTTARDNNLKDGSRCPIFNLAEPTHITIASANTSLGETIFFLRYIQPMIALGWSFDIEVQDKLIPILQHTDLFKSVSRINHSRLPNHFWLDVGDLPLAAMQCGITSTLAPLKIKPDNTLVEKYNHQLAQFGPPPYIGVSWRAGPVNKVSKQGVRLLDKSIDPVLLGKALNQTKATIINLQRLPDQMEQNAFLQAIGKPVADFTALNNNLPGMLAMLSIINEYVTVSNTNVHLREGLGLPSQVFVSRPFQDWRWGYEGDTSVWYPNSVVYRQAKALNWLPEINRLTDHLSMITQSALHSNQSNKKTLLDIKNSNVGEVVKSDKQLLQEGWEKVSYNIPLAIKHAQQVLNAKPNDANALHLLGWAAVQDLKFELGLSVLENAVQQAPNNGNIWRDYIRAHTLIDKPNEALQIGHKCLDNPKLFAKGVVHYALGSAYLRLGDDLQALASFERCLSLIPNHIDSLSAAGMILLRLGDGHARLGFKASSGRTEARNPNNHSIWTCPVLRGDVKGLKVLIVRSMGLGDELSYLRYLPYLIDAGVQVTYWCGSKLMPLLARLPMLINLVPDTESMPDPTQFDLPFIIHELPMAVEYLNAPEIADPLQLMVDKQKLEKWKTWLTAQGEGPYIGFNWRAGVGGRAQDNIGYTRLAKVVAPKDFASALRGIKGTWISLQRNVTKNELADFEAILGNKVIDIAGQTDDLDDLLCLMSLLDENIGVSNTNMHLRAGLSKGSKVLVNFPSGDWRWGNYGSQSTWFKKCKVYRETIEDGWQTSLVELRNDLLNQFGLAEKKPIKKIQQAELASQRHMKVIWVTAGEIKKGDAGFYSPLSSAQERVINVAKLLETRGWQSDYLIESVSELMGGWHDKLPVAGDVVVFSKVFTNHAITLMQDAKARGAKVVLDVFNDFTNQPERDLHQQHMIAEADVVISSPELKEKWQKLNQRIQFYYENLTDQISEQTKSACLQNWLNLFDALEKQTIPTQEAESCNIDESQKSTITNEITKPKHSAQATKRLIWIAAGEVVVSEKGIDSPLASTRYRVLIPAANLGPLGWQSQVVNERDLITSGWGSFSLSEGDVLIVSKVFNLRLINFVEQAKQKGCHLMVDYCDYHFDRQDDMGQLHNRLLSMADLVTTCSTELQQLIQAKTQAPVHFITDSFESNKAAPSVSVHNPLKLVWFGSATNLDTLTEFIKGLAEFAKTKPISLDIVTHFNQGQQFAKHHSTEHLRIHYVPWSLAAQQEAVQNADLVVIPTIEAQIKNVKSPNRIVEAIWLGKFVIAGNLPAYEPFKEYAAITTDYITALQWFINHQEKALEMVRAGQAFIAKHHTPKKIGELWDKAINYLHLDSLPPTSHESYIHTIPVDTNNKVLVVISYYQATNIEYLLNLLNSIDRYDPGCVIDVLVVVNSVSNEKISINLKQHNLEVVYRENTGMNIGAWDYGWKMFQNYGYYIFLQDECVVVSDGWAIKQIEPFSDSTIGMVGESLNSKWHKPWDVLIKHPDFGNRAQKYQQIISQYGIDPGKDAFHLRSLIWSFSQQVLKKLRGFPLGANKDQCVASEIAVSKHIESLGLKFIQVDVSRCFRYIKHREWSMNNKKIPIAFDKQFQYGKLFNIAKDNYKVKPRSDMFALIDIKPTTICEVGCADGTNLIEITKQLNFKVAKEDLVGVDIAKIEGCEKYEHITFIHQTAEDFVEKYKEKKFDLVLLSDVVEHLYNPWLFFDKLKSLLNPGAMIVLSVPNIQNLNYLYAINSGGFYYKSTGLFDVTHIRFFSVETLMQLIESTGLIVSNHSFRPDYSLNELRKSIEVNIKKSGSASIDLDNLKLSVTSEMVDRYFAQQILFAVKALE